MSTVRSLIDKIRVVACSNSDLGSRFEGLIRQYFLHDPLYSEQFTDVWRWNDWKEKAKEPDTGIDLVAKNRYDDGYTAIQCKCWSENDSIQRSDIDSFLVRSAKLPFTRRIIVTTTAKWSKHAEDAIHGMPIPVQRLDINDLENSTIDWSQFDPDKAEVKLKPKKELFDHQITALDQVRKGYETSDRGQLIMACGTGKTFTSLKIAEEHAGKNGLVLFLVPSLSLLQQTLREWTAESAIPLHCYAVCSDVKIGKHDDSTPLSPDDLAIPATTDAESLSSEWRVTSGVKRNDKMTVIFATYQSIDVIHEAQTGKKKDSRHSSHTTCHFLPEFDIIICDEAHRTTGARVEGDDESHFVKVHDNNTIKGKKRLYMTATPRLYSADSKAKAKQRDIPLWSMDNEDHYGKVFYYLGFSRAVSQGLLSDYKVVILGVDEQIAPHIEAAAVATGKKKKELPLVEPAKMIGCWSALAGKYSDEWRVTSGEKDESLHSSHTTRHFPLHRAVAFTTSIKQSETFCDQFNSIITEYLGKVASDEWRVTSNAEGVDFLAIDDRMVINYEHFKIVSGLDSLAEINRLDWADILLYAAISERGDLRDRFTNAKSGNIDSKQHSGGAGTQFDGRVSPVSGNFQRFAVRIGDTVDSLEQSGVSFGGDAQRLVKQLRRDKQVAQWLVEISEVVMSDEWREKKNSPLATHHSPLNCAVEHVDGTMNAIKRNELLQWLKADHLAGTPAHECRILSNARCLSEGVDVPALDAVIFLTPRKSKVDVVQSVGRVMRKAEGKEYGYVIIPVVVKAGTKPEDALHDSEAYEMVWGVLQALRAHDDRFQNQINVFELDGKEPEKIEVHFIGTSTAPSVLAGTPGNDKQDVQQVLGFSYDDVKIWKNALYATLVKKCGEKRYWEDWAKDVASLAQKHIETLKKLADGEAHKYDFMAFLEHLRSNLNDSITEQDAIEMLAQYIITKPVFDALFDSENFSKHNPVAQALDKVVALLEDAESVACDEWRVAREENSPHTTHHSPLSSFYESVRTRVAGVKTAEGRQKIIIELYDKFFKTAFPKLSEKLGIVYTPVEVVDFILKSVDQALRQEFGKGITDKDIHVLDPFTGTGTFIVRLLQSGLIAPEDLQRKYENELHANELVLLAYYIAAVNIENTYRERVMSDEWRVTSENTHHSPLTTSHPFPGIVHTDTFTMTQRQKETRITVIIGNPPYSVGQRSENDANKNTRYEQLDERIRTTYAAYSSAKNKNSLYDSYIRSFRWASDCIGNRGIICFVSNGGWLDGNAMDGFRKCLDEEFTDIYVFNLRGGIRGRQGDSAKREGQNVFPIMTAVAVTLVIKNPKKAGKPCTINYYGFDDYLKKNEKLQFLSDAEGLHGIQWQKIAPNAKYDWINLRCKEFDNFIGIDEAFEMKTLGVQTNRDAWCYNFSRIRLTDNITRIIAFYNEQVKTYVERKQWDNELTTEDFITYSPTNISWARRLKDYKKQKEEIQYSPQNIVPAMYRPFCKTNFYFTKFLNHEVSQMPRVFPKPELENMTIAVETGKMGQTFSCLMIDTVPDCCVFGYTQCFPLYTYERVERGEGLGLRGEEETHPSTLTPHNYIRRENISDAMLKKFQERYEGLGTRDEFYLTPHPSSLTPNPSPLTKEDIFYYVYGILHSRCYRERFAADLKKQLPRIPLVGGSGEWSVASGEKEKHMSHATNHSSLFWTFSEAGRKLAELHLNYETGEMYPLEEVVSGEGRGTSGEGRVVSYRVEKMKYARHSPHTTNHSPLTTSHSQDKSRIIYNDQLHLAGIPAESHRYIVNGKSALDWIVERYAVTTHKNSGIVNDPNDWCREIGNERYIVDLIKRIVHLSVESVKIIEGLPELEF